jgi:predicted metal-dependent hydrolase
MAPQGGREENLVFESLIFETLKDETSTHRSTGGAKGTGAGARWRRGGDRAAADVSLERGIELFNRGLYWEAHEAWEEAWTPDRRGPDRGFYKGLIQVAAGCLHYGRRNRRGAVNKWRSGADFLRPYLPSHNGVDLAPLVARVDAFLVAMDREDWPAGLEMPLVRRAAPE